MHEFGIAKAIVHSVLHRIESEYAGNVQRVDKLRLRVGRLNNVTRDSLQNAVNVLAGNTILSNVELEVEEVDGSEVTVVEILGEPKEDSSSGERRA